MVGRGHRGRDARGLGWLHAAIEDLGSGGGVIAFATINDAVVMRRITMAAAITRLATEPREYARSPPRETVQTKG